MAVEISDEEWREKERAIKAMEDDLIPARVAAKRKAAEDAAKAARGTAMPTVAADAPLHERAKAYEAIAVETLARVCQDEDKPAAAQVAAANAILDRSAGKPVQAVIHAGESDMLPAILADMRALRAEMYGLPAPRAVIDAEEVT